MRRREILLFMSAVAAAPGRALAQSAKVLRVGAANAQPRTAPQWVAFVQRMRELGYVEDKNFTFDHKQIASPDLWEAGYREAVARKPDIIIAAGPAQSLSSALAATRALPIVMIAIDYDPIALGFVASLARPGGNITGVHVQRVELTAKRLQLLKSTFPDMDAAIVFWDRHSADQWEAARSAARQLGVQLTGVEFRERPYDYDSSVAGLPSGSRRFLFVLGSPFFFLDRTALGQFALRHRMVSSFVVRDFVAEGALMSYGVSLPGMWELAAQYVDRIARGAKAGDLPIQQPTKFELAVNLRTANAIGVELPSDLLVRADDIIE